MSTLLNTSRAASLLTSVGLALAISGCNTFNKLGSEDDTEKQQKTDYYLEESSRPQKVRVIDPHAVGLQDNTREEKYAVSEVKEAVITDHPSRYVVKEGDTLWDISGEFLSKPWLWPEIWDVNPQIANPHLIYPGDEVALRYIDGRPTIVVSRNGEIIDSTLPYDGPGGVKRLSPQIREESLASAIPTISGDTIQQFLVYPRVVDEKTVKKSPYIIGDFEGRLVSATGHQVYVRGDINEDQTQYGIFRESKELRDPDSKELLGYEVVHVGDASLLHMGDPATMLITSNRMETIAGDRVMSQNQNFAVHNYVPRVPEIQGEGKIISLFNAISQSGRGQVAVLNLGTREGVRVGDVMAIEHRGGRILDRFSGKPHDYVNIPNTRIGVLMVFRTFDKVAYGLIMESTRPIHLHDAVTGI